VWMVWPKTPYTRRTDARETVGCQAETNRPIKQNVASRWTKTQGKTFLWLTGAVVASIQHTSGAQYRAQTTLRPWPTSCALRFEKRGKTANQAGSHHGRTKRGGCGTYKNDHGVDSDLSRKLALEHGPNSSRAASEGVAWNIWAVPRVFHSVPPNQVFCRHDRMMRILCTLSLPLLVYCRFSQVRFTAQELRV